MIPFDFEYYKPDSLEEASSLFNNLSLAGKQPMYYGGGTEIISMSRAGNIYTDAVIDIKGIPQCNTYEIKDDSLIIGSAVTLTNIAELNLFPLLSSTVKRIADHTIQDKITLGGNICSTIIYREAVLPLMLSDSEIIIINTAGTKKIPLNQIFHERIHLNKGDLISQIIIKTKYIDKPYCHAKRTKNDKIDYPLITLAALKDDSKINIAFSGLCEFPFRSPIVEKYFNEPGNSKDEKIKNVINNFPYKILDDLNGSSEYRKFVIHKMLFETLEKFERVD